MTSKVRSSCYLGERSCFMTSSQDQSLLVSPRKLSFCKYFLPPWMRERTYEYFDSRLIGFLVKNEEVRTKMMIFEKYYIGLYNFFSYCGCIRGYHKASKHILSFTPSFHWDFCAPCSVVQRLKRLHLPTTLKRNCSIVAIIIQGSVCMIKFRHGCMSDN
jgi:hypothetical protein